MAPIYVLFLSGMFQDLAVFDWIGFAIKFGRGLTSAYDVNELCHLYTENLFP